MGRKVSVRDLRNRTPDVIRAVEEGETVTLTVSGRPVADMRAARRRVNLFDAIVAATAAAHGLAVWTQDGDFEVIAEIAGGPPVLLA
jgi:antitoxin (DNA-binding transcriptional repressor) of toxin-antitoxin stability system